MNDTHAHNARDDKRTLGHSSTWIDRRTALSGLTAGMALAESGVALASGVVPTQSTQLVDLDPIRTELVMNIIVTCSAPTTMGSSSDSKDGVRPRVWPIVGGRFHGPRLRGTVVPGGADLPVIRPDGVTVVDAFYRLQEDDGTTIIIHNIGMRVADAPGEARYRSLPTFTTVAGRHDWLNKSLFVATLITEAHMPASLRLAREGQNDRLIQIHRFL